MDGWKHSAEETEHGSIWVGRSRTDQEHTIHQRQLAQIHKSGRVALINPQDFETADWLWLVNYLSERFIVPLRAL